MKLMGNIDKIIHVSSLDLHLRFIYVFIKLFIKVVLDLLNSVSFNRNVEHLKTLKTRLTHEEVENASITVFLCSWIGLDVNKGDKRVETCGLASAFFVLERRLSVSAQRCFT